jgi:hypothetical protein
MEVINYNGCLKKKESARLSEICIRYQFPGSLDGKVVYLQNGCYKVTARIVQIMLKQTCICVQGIIISRLKLINENC